MKTSVYIDGARPWVDTRGAGALAHRVASENTSTCSERIGKSAPVCICNTIKHIYIYIEFR